MLLFEGKESRLSFAKGQISQTWDIFDGKDKVSTSLFNTLLDMWPNLVCQTPTETLFTIGSLVTEQGFAGQICCKT